MCLSFCHSSAKGLKVSTGYNILEGVRFFVSLRAWCVSSGCWCIQLVRAWIRDGSGGALLRKRGCLPREVLEL
ncbi:hypothetical protein Mapa_004298 [Marchantia paleacea]|nr:hypothetical protein Mapa_004298 [Marchantia paleacea]